MSVFVSTLQISVYPGISWLRKCVRVRVVSCPRDTGRKKVCVSCCKLNFHFSLAMSTLVRNTTLTFSRRNRYELLGLQGKDKMVKSISYRRRRAKQRQIFLTTYKLSSLNSNTFVEPQKPKLKLKKVAVKVKKIVTSVLMFMRVGSFRSCSSRSQISATSPNRKNSWGCCSDVGLGWLIILSIIFGSFTLRSFSVCLWKRTQAFLYWNAEFFRFQTHPY